MGWGAQKPVMAPKSIRQQTAAGIVLSAGQAREVNRAILVPCIF